MLIPLMKELLKIQKRRLLSKLMITKRKMNQHQWMMNRLLHKTNFLKSIMRMMINS